MRIIAIVALAAMCSGCAQSPKMLWIRTDGQRALTDPVLAQQYQVDRTICLGEREKADLSGVTVTQGGLAGVVAVQQRGQAADAVAQGCMAQKGYILVREDEADAKAAELAAIEQEKKQREAAANAPAPAATPTAKKRPPAPKPSPPSSPASAPSSPAADQGSRS